ncbi:hypothetical protein Clacol_000901 [Clathrus columnatus]|uniref:Csf1 N-terminal domain-containing protein n=1 Tax=Clathrus columnatus TaxID=1419009 RepID=A0AAV4ZY05_9AGAM|nr:hypothetical protein Clacol_000901 [Clathrus columnatus]
MALSHLASNWLLALLIGYALHLNWWTDSHDRIWVSLVWRYWIWRTRNDFVNPDRGEDGVKDLSKESKLPSRIYVSLEGVEWHLYNRTAAFNDILSHIQQVNNEKGGSSIRAFSSRSETDRRNILSPHETITSSTIIREAASKVKGLKDKLTSWLTILQPELYEILPIDVSVVRGAILFGNGATPRLLVAKFSAGSGSYSMVPMKQSRSLHDKYKIVVDARFRDAKMDLERNHRYRGSLSDQGRVIAKRFKNEYLPSRLTYSVFRDMWTSTKRREALDKIEDMYSRTMFEQHEHQNHYAVVETILDTPELQLSYHWDIPGAVPSAPVKEEFKGDIHSQVGNGDLSPQFGLDVIVHGGIIRYGPWADRQRIELQRIFFPQTYRTNTPTASLNPGDTRIYTEMKIFIELRDTTTLHIPFREPSKDWQYNEGKFSGASKKRREAGWIEIHAGGNSTINYVLPWFATSSGYDVLMQLHLDEVKILSSVNEMKLLSATSAKILCEMPTPLHWKDFRHWIFEVSLQAPTFHLIRDHIHLLTDLGKDWISGPPTDYEKWIPMRYTANIAIRDFEFNLYLNDQNLITRPHARDANSILSLRGKTLRSAVDIPSNTFRPSYVKYPFWVESPNVNLVLTLPNWNTHAMFSSFRTSDFGALRAFRLEGSYLSHSEVLPGNIDQLKFSITGSDVVFIAFGWVIRNLMSLRENYFGNFTHFSTLDEYVYKREHNIPVGDIIESKWKEGRSNVFEVTLDVLFHRTVVVFPAGLTGYEYSVDPWSDNTSSGEAYRSLGTSVLMLQPEFQLYLRTHDFSMEMDVHTSPVKLSVVEHLSHSLLYEPYTVLGRRKLHLDGLNIVAHRLFGPQPRTATYLCLWEFYIQGLMGSISLTELQGLLSAMTSFRLNFVDAVNAPAAELTLPSDPDVTFLKLDLSHLDVALDAGKSVIQLFLQNGIKFDYNDLAGNYYKKMIELRIPTCVLRGLLKANIHPEQWYEASSISFDLAMDMYFSPAHWEDLAREQRDFIAAEDAPTRRAWFLYESPKDKPTFRTSGYKGGVHLPQPAFPGMKKRERKLSMVSQRYARQKPSLTIHRTVDSDQDEHISEADRDARLAYSRPTTPLPTMNNFQDPSTSGESDTEDYSSHGTNTDFDDITKPTPHGNAPPEGYPPLAYYRHIVRKYESHINDAYIHSPLFTVLKDPTSSLEDIPVPPEEDSRPFNPNTSDESPSYPNQSCTTISIRNNHLIALLTPLCIHIGLSLIEDVTAYWRSSSIESLVDSLTADFLATAGLEPINVPSRTDFNLEFQTLQLRILQSLMTVGQTLSPVVDPPSNTTVAISHDSRIISDAIVVINGSQTRFSKITSQKQNSVLFGSSFAVLRSRVGIYIVHDTSFTSRNMKLLSQSKLRLGGSKAAVSPSSMHANIGNLNFELLGNASVEIICATIQNLIRTYHDLRRPFSICKKTVHTAQWRRVWGILQVSRAIPIDDPLSQIQPSYLIQTGRPDRLRYDPSWKLFMYLRHCLRLLGPGHRRTLMEMPRFDEVGLLPPTPQEISQVLERRLGTWGYDLSREHVMALPFMSCCFSPIIQPSSSTQGRGPCTIPIFVDTGIIAVLIHGVDSVPSVNTGNVFTIGPLAASYRTRKQTVTAQPLNKLHSIHTHILDGEYLPVHHHVLTLSMGDIRFSFHPNFVIFLQRLLPLYSEYLAPVHEGPSALPLNSKKALMTHNLWECFVRISQVAIQAAVEGMVAEIGFKDMDTTGSVLSSSAIARSQLRSRSFASGSCILRFSELFVRVRQAQDKHDPFRFNEREVLASLVLTQASLHNSCRTLGGDAAPDGSCLLAMQSVVISVPRSVLLTYQLIEEWRVQYLPKVHAMSRDLVSELNKRHKQHVNKPKGTIKQFMTPTIDFQFYVRRVGLLLQVMHGTWFSWDVNNTLGFLKCSPVSNQCRLTYGVRLSDQRIKITSHSAYDISGDRVISFRLPAFEAAGNYEGGRVRSHAIIDKFSIHLKPQYMDDILVVQHNLGTHFYDVLDLISKNRNKRSPTRSNKAGFDIRYDVAFMLRGFRIDIDGPTTVLDLTWAEMTGTAKNEPNLIWNFAVASLALGLSHHSTEKRVASDFDRRFRTAYMVLDMKARSLSSPGLRGNASSAEKFIRQERRAIELEEIKKKTQRVIRVFDVPKAEVTLNRSASWLDKYSLSVNVTDIGVAFPLKLKNEVEVDSIGSVPAFLLAIKSAMFSSKGSRSGQASMERLSLQFVERFDQTEPQQFDGDRHPSRNKLLYPHMKAKFRSVAMVPPRELHLAANVDGFILDLDPGIVDNVFSLIDVYKRGKARIEKLSYLPQRASTSDTKLERRTFGSFSSTDTGYQPIMASHVLMTLVFHTGEMHLRGMSERLGGAKSPPKYDLPEIIQFPTITVWGEYRAKSRLNNSLEVDSSLLTFRTQVHSTINHIKPSMLDFVIGIMDRLQDQLQLPETKTQMSDDIPHTEVSEIVSHESSEFLSPGVLNGIQLSFSLRIDSSRLELLSDLDVIASVVWESGGFLVTLSPTTRTLQFTGSVTGLKLDLRHTKHQAGAVQTAHADARGLAFSVSYSQNEDNREPCLSVVLDTEFDAGFRFDRLQDILIFKAVYIDRIPVAASSTSKKSSPSPAVESNNNNHVSNLNTVILVRARQIKLTADLGHNITSAVATFKSAIFTSRITPITTDFRFIIAALDLDLAEDRPLGGYMRLPDFYFTTSRGRSARLELTKGASQMLDVTLGSGPLDIVVQSEKRVLLQYHADPFFTHIADDWSAIDWRLPSEDRVLRLEFSVTGKELLIIANLQSVPRLLMLLDKLRSDLQTQEKEAQTALDASSMRYLPRPDNTLTEVADAMIRSSRKKIRDSSALTYTVIQHMKLQLSSLRVALFRTPNDLEMALFQGRDVQAELDRLIHSLDSPPSRSLRLAFSSLYLSKYSSLKYRAVGDELLASPWLEKLLKGASEWTIARLPAMNLEMNSDVEYDASGRQEILYYDLVATPDERVQSLRSIYVSLNLSLYIWAGALVKGLGIEIEKALAATSFSNKTAIKDVAASIATPPTLVSSNTADSSLKVSDYLAVPPSASSSSTLQPPPRTVPLAADQRLPRRYHARSETSIDYGTIQQLGEATPDAQAPWLGLKETVPPRVHEYATLPMEVLMKMLLEIYNKQLKMATRSQILYSARENGEESISGESEDDEL